MRAGSRLAPRPAPRGPRRPLLARCRDSRTRHTDTRDPKYKTRGRHAAPPSGPTFANWPAGLQTATRLGPGRAAPRALPIGVRGRARLSNRQRARYRRSKFRVKAMGPRLLLRCTLDASHAHVWNSACCRLERSRQMECLHLWSNALPEDLPLSLAQVADAHRPVSLTAYAFERLEARTAVGM